MSITWISPTNNDNNNNNNKKKILIWANINVFQIISGSVLELPTGASTVQSGFCILKINYAQFP
jgi:hypothetical protein